MDAPFGVGVGFTSVHVDNVEVFVNCGLHAWEKHPERPNRLLVSVSLYADDRKSRPDGWYMDYDRIRTYILGLSSRPHTDLLEQLLDDLVTHAFGDKHVDAVFARIDKPDIFPEAQAAGVEALRFR